MSKLCFNALSPSVSYWVLFTLILIFKVLTENNSYDRCVYEPVDDKSLSYIVSPKTNAKENSGRRG